MKIFNHVMTAVLFLLLANSVWADEKAEQWVKDVKKNYESLKNVSADFTQTFHWKLTGEVQQVQGKIYAREGNQFKIETADQLIVTDGKTLWTLNKANNQVVVDWAENAADENPFIHKFLEKFTQNYDAQMDVNSTEGALVSLLLTSKNEEQFVPFMRLSIDPKSKFIQKIEQTDINENVTTFEMQGIDTSISLSAQDFKFSAPENADIIDMR